MSAAELKFSRQLAVTLPSRTLQPFVKYKLTPLIYTINRTNPTYCYYENAASNKALHYTQPHTLIQEYLAWFHFRPWRCFHRLCSLHYLPMYDPPTRSYLGYFTYFFSPLLPTRIINLLSTTLFLYNYIRGITTEPGVVCRSDIEALELTKERADSSAPRNTKEDPASYYQHRKCSLCKLVQPPKATHCYMCNHCVKELDQYTYHLM